MRIKVARHFIIFTLSAILLFSGHAHSKGLVLCVGADGHVELEFTFGGDCSTDSRKHSSKESDHLSTDSMKEGSEHCGRCIDIPIESGDADTCHSFLQLQKNYPIAPLAGAVLATLSRDEFSRSTYRVRSQSYILPTSPAYVRTVSLII